MYSLAGWLSLAAIIWVAKNVQSFAPDRHGVFSTEERRMTLDSFNSQRRFSTHVNKVGYVPTSMNFLIWDADLTPAALEMAYTCTDAIDQQSNYGQVRRVFPLWSASDRTAPPMDLNISAILEIWREEVRNYWLPDHGPTCNIDDIEGCDTYRQIVQDSARYVSCAMSFCEDLATEDLGSLGAGGYSLVCIFDKSSRSSSPMTSWQFDSTGTIQPCGNCSDSYSVCYEDYYCSASNCSMSHCIDGNGTSDMHPRYCDCECLITKAIESDYSDIDAYCRRIGIRPPLPPITTTSMQDTTSLSSTGQPTSPSGSTSGQPSVTPTTEEQRSAADVTKSSLIGILPTALFFFVLC